MKLNIFKKGFSLTELLIVLVVVAVLFSAMLPIMTKRRAGATKGDEPVWQFVGDVEQDAYFDKEVTGANVGAYVGMKPKSGEWEPYSKLVIKADQVGPNNKPQAMIQFRYGDGDGNLAAVFALNQNSNFLTISNLYDINYASTHVSSNTAFGSGIFAKVKRSLNNTTIGANSSMISKNYGGSGNGSIGNNNTVFGVNANKYGAAVNSVILGAHAGQTELSKGIENSVVIGANNLATPDSKISQGVLIGNGNAIDGKYGYGNIIIGSRYSGGSDDVKYNTLIGEGALEGYSEGGNSYSVTNPQYITSVGYNSCNSLAYGNASPKYKTCIGTTSGSAFGKTKNMNWETDDAEHIFIGGVPQSDDLGGRAVLEVHNVSKNNLDKTGNLHPNGANPDIAPTVVMNSNLVVRGNTYLTTVDGVLRPMTFSMPQEEGSEFGRDACKTCHGGHHRWYSECKGGFLNVFLSIIGYAAIVVGAIIGFGGGALPGVGIVVLAESFIGEGNYRAKDSKSASVITFNKELKCVYNNKQNYPYNGDSGSASYGSYCPRLQLSDVRLKSDIRENNDGIEKLLMVMPYNFTFKADKASKPQVGVMAQDLQKYFPNSVTEGEDGYLNIRWDEIFFATINSVKSLDETLSGVEKDVSDMENDVIKLASNHHSTKKRIEELNKRIDKLEK